MSKISEITIKAATTQSESFKGIMFLNCGLFVFSLQDVIIKMLSSTYPVHEIVFIRSFVALIPILLIAYFEGGFKRLKTKRHLANIVRAALMFIAYLSFYLALATLPLPDAVTIALSIPFFISILSIRFLNEKPGFSYWVAISVGFLGVVVMMKPGAASFEPASLLALLTAVAYSLQAIITRRLGCTDSAVSMAFYSTIFYIVASGIIGLSMGDGVYASSNHPSVQFMLRPWQMPTPKDFGLIIVVGFTAGAGFYFLSQAYRLSKATTVAPFEYISVPLSVLWGFLFWKHIPMAYDFIGMLLIVGTGMFIIRKEMIANRTGMREYSEKPMRVRMS